MCGIAAIYNIKENKLDNLNNIKKILTNINLGVGPTKLWSVSQCYLGIARLSIIDLKSGNQPISDSSKRYFVVFNGEIYNYLSLKRDLEKLNYKFNTMSDTELVLNSYIHWEIISLKN